MKRSGFTLIEMIAAILASTVLMMSLAATVVVSTRLLEVSPAGQQADEDRELAERIAADLRYAVQVNDTDTDAFQIVRNDVRSGLPQTITYRIDDDGLRRQVADRDEVTLQSAAAGHQFEIAQHDAIPVPTASTSYPRVRSTTTAATSARQTSLSIPIPSGCKPGDLLMMCVSARTPSTLTPSPSGWQSQHVGSTGDLRLYVFTRPFVSGLSPTVTLALAPSSSMAAVIFAIEDAAPSTPVQWSSSRSGFAWMFLPQFHPGPRESSSINDRQLNVQIFAAERSPWIATSLGMASFTDLATVRASASDYWSANSLAVAIRSGPTPAIGNGSRMLFLESVAWLQWSAVIGAVP